MDVSVIINTYSLDRYDDFCEAVEAVRNQTYESIEIVLVVDGNEPLYQRVREEYGSFEDIIVHCTEENVGNSASRTAGAKQATGDVLVVTDDDGVADPHWIEELVAVYESTDTLAVGGKVEPVWVDGKPAFFPEEFLWLVGCTENGFADHLDEVRNTYGPNLSFRTAVFEELGGFSKHVGRHGDKQIQAHETEICSRLRNRYGRGVVYTEKAIINHKVYPYRTELSWLVRRCFWQGYSKRVLETLVPNSTGKEYDFLKQLLVRFAPERIRSFVRNPSFGTLLQFVTMFVFTFLVGLGYIYGLVTVRDIETEEK